MSANQRAITDATVTRIAAEQEPATGTREHDRWELAKAIVAQRGATQKFTLFPRIGSLDRLIRLLEQFEALYGHDGSGDIVAD